MTWNWPNGRKVAVSLTFDVDAEAGVLAEGSGYRRRLTALSEGTFGVTRGIPRILELLRRYEVTASFFVPGYTAERHPGLCAALVEDGHEVGHHGYLHLRSDQISEEEQREEIEKGLSALAGEGVTPSGYRSASWELTPETFQLLIEHEFAYDSSCMGDDRPYVQSYGELEILELPIHWSLDDWPRFGWMIDGGGNVADPEELRTSWLAEFNAAREEGRHITLTMHPEVIGRAYRLAALESLLVEMRSHDDVWFAPLGRVADHVRPVLTALTP